jgi:transcriptional regulator with XRE-family HTH domain
MDAKDYLNAIRATGMNQADIAERAGIPQSTISKIERDVVLDVMSKTYCALQALHAQINLKPNLVTDISNSPQKALFEIRRQRLIWLTTPDKTEQGCNDLRMTQAEFFRRTGKAISYLYQLRLDPCNCHAKNLGEELARGMEAALGLPPLWFDLPFIEKVIERRLMPSAFSPAYASLIWPTIELPLPVIA